MKVAATLASRASLPLLLICSLQAGAQAIAPEFQVNTTTNDWQFDSSVAPLDDGGFIVAWHDASAGTARAQRFTATAAKVGGELTVPDVTGTMPLASFIGPRVTGL